MTKIFLVLAFVLAIAPSAHAACIPDPGDPSVYYDENGVICTPPPNNPPNTTSGFVPLAPIPGLTQGATADSAGLANFFNNLYKYLIGLAAVLAVIEIIWGGLEISTKDSVSKQSDGRKRITQAILGLILVLSPVLVFSVINPAILNLSLNLPELKTTTSTSPNGGGGGGGSDPATAAANAAGCNVTGTLVKKASCPTQQAAQEFATKCNSGSGSVLSSTKTDPPCAAWQQQETIDAYTRSMGGTARCITYPAACDTRSGSITGPYSFAETSGWTWWVGYRNYEPLDRSPDTNNTNNGNDVLKFAAACTSDGGRTCISAGTGLRPCVSSVIQLLVQSRSVSTSCWNMTMSCVNGYSMTSTDFCTGDPKFTVVNIQ